MTEASERLGAQWEQAAARGEPIDVAAEMMRLTMVIVSRALFGRGGAGTGGCNWPRDHGATA